MCFTHASQINEKVFRLSGLCAAVWVQAEHFKPEAALKSLSCWSISRMKVKQNMWQHSYLHSSRGLECRKKTFFLMFSSRLNSKNFPKMTTYLSSVLVQPGYGQNCVQENSSFSHMRGAADLLDPSHTPSPTIRHKNTITHCSCVEVETLTQAPYSIIEI